MPGDGRKPDEGSKTRDVAYGEAVRTPEERKGMIDSEQAAREESEGEEGRIARGAGMKTDEERIAEAKGKEGVGELTDHVDESERHGGEPEAEQAAETRRAPGQGQE